MNNNLEKNLTKIKKQDLEVVSGGVDNTESRESLEERRGCLVTFLKNIQDLREIQSEIYLMDLVDDNYKKEVKANLNRWIDETESYSREIAAIDRLLNKKN